MYIYKMNFGNSLLYILRLLILLFPTSESGAL